MSRVTISLNKRMNNAKWFMEFYGRKDGLRTTFYRPVGYLANNVHVDGRILVGVAIYDTLHNDCRN